MTEVAEAAEGVEGEPVEVAEQVGPVEEAGPVEEVEPVEEAAAEPVTAHTGQRSQEGDEMIGALVFSERNGFQPHPCLMHLKLK
mmetsp:Transcript_9885/g.20107  ORF Transcript_9885/g.20107 Transcript_9885/m.20107 type:complete len:84 (-) Transcript_9885:3059-3310(-)